MRHGGFNTRLTIAIGLAYIGPPILGLSFLVFITRVVTTSDVAQLMSGSILPYYIIGSTIVAVLFFRWFLRPVARLDGGDGDPDEALTRMRSFLWTYWVCFIGRHFMGVVVVLTSSQSVLSKDANAGMWIRMLSLAVMLSCLFGLPAFVYLLDFFAATFKKHRLREPLFRVRTRVFMIAVLLPVLLNTAVLQYLMPRLGGLDAELVGLWLVLLTVAIVAAYNLMRSLDQSMTALRQVSAQDHNKGQRSLRPKDLQLRSMDEFGVLTCEYRELLTNLQQQATLLSLRNQVLLTSNEESDPDAVFLRLLDIVSTHLGSKCSALVSITAMGQIEILASKGQRSLPSTINAEEKLLDAVRASTTTILPATEASWWPRETAEFVVLPLREASESSGYQAVLVSLEENDGSLASDKIKLLGQLGPEVAAAVRATQVQKEKSELEEMLLGAQRMEVIGRLAAGIAHDFNNILMVVSGSAGMLKIEANANELAGIAEHTELIMEASDRGSDLTQQLLTFARPSEGSIDVLDVNEVVRNLEAFLRRLLPDEIEFEVNLADTANVKANKGQLEQVVTNLVINARDAMEGTGQLRLETSESGPWLELRVIDSGSGMSPDVAAHIFEPFYSTKPESKGTGLGLATVYGIVKNCAGSIEVESTVGKGTSMIVRLPTTAESLQEKPEVRRPKRQSRTGTVLFAEDDKSIRKIIADLLKSKGFDVVAVANGRDAIKKIEDDSLKIDLLLSDIIMPGVKGTEVATRMADKRPDTRILLMTGYADPEMLGKAIAAGLPIIRKPFAPEQLLVQIDELLS